MVREPILKYGYFERKEDRRENSSRRDCRMKKKDVETVENKKHVSHRFHSTATAAAIYFLMKTTWLFLNEFAENY